MFTPAKSKNTIVNQKDEFARYVYSSHSPKPHLSSSNLGDTYSVQHRKNTTPNHEVQKSLSSYRDVSNSTGQYKAKRPVEISDIIENDKIMNMSTSTPAVYEVKPFGNYDSPTANDILNKVAFLSTRPGSHRADHLLSEVEYEATNSSFRTPPLTQKGSNTTSYLAEKVYSMKYKNPTILGSILPLSKSRTPTNLQMSTSAKNATSNPDRSILRDMEDSRGDYGSPSKLEVSMRGEPLGKDKNMGLLAQNKSATNSHKSLGKLLNDGKPTSNVLQADQLKRGNSWGKIKSKPALNDTKRSSGADLIKKKASIAGPTNSELPSSRDRRASKPTLNAMIRRMDEFADRIEGAYYRIKQRHQRLVFVQLLEALHQHKVRVTQYLEQKGISLKAKYFEQWQRFMIEVYTERQKKEQDKADMAKYELSGSFYDRKLLRKYFCYLQEHKREIPPPKMSHTENTRSAKTLRHNTLAPIKTTAPQSTKASTLNSSQNKINISQMQPKSSIPKKTVEDRSFVSPQKKPIAKLSNTSEKRSVSVGKGLRNAQSPKTVVNTTTTQQNNRAVTPKTRSKKLSIALSVNSPQKAGEIPRFGKSVTYLNGHTELEEPLDASQSPKKQPQESELEQSFGCKNASSSTEKGGEMFDSVLNDILHTSANMQDQDLIPTLKSLAQENDPKKETPRTAAPVKKDTLVPKPVSPAKTSRDRYTTSPLKGAKTSARGQNLTSRGTTESKIKPQEVKKASNVKESTSKPQSKMVTIADSEHEDQDKEAQNIEKAKKFYNGNLYNKYVLPLFFRLKHLTKGNVEKAVEHRKRVLMQNAYIWLLAVSSQAKDELEEKTALAKHHFENNLQIKALSGLLENYVKGFKQDQIAQNHYQLNVYNSYFQRWRVALPEVRDEKETNEAAYNEIISRFRFIVLAEKAIRRWKDAVASNKKKPVVPKKKYGGK